MKAETRALKMSLINKVSDYVNVYDQGTDNDGEEFIQWKLSWSSPKYRQFAVIDAVMGEIEEFYLQSGTELQKADVGSWVSLIDRRINYLWERHRVEIKRIMAKQNIGDVA